MTSSNKTNLVWIDNLQTGSGKLANEKLPYVREYIEKFGRRKCEANAILKIRELSESLCEQTILKYLKNDQIRQYSDDLQADHKEVKDLMAKYGIDTTIQGWIDVLDAETD